MTHPWNPGGVTPFVAYPQPVPLPPGLGCLVIAVNRGPNLLPAPSTSLLKIDGQRVRIPGEGTWCVPVPAGQHDVRFTDLIGVPAMTTQTVVEPGASNYLSFRFGGWRNRVHDAQGTDVTKFGMWSNYTVALIALVAGSVLCCGGFSLVALLSDGGS